MLSDMQSNPWTKSAACLYKYNPSGQYFARVRFGGRLYRRALDTGDYQLARRKLADFRRDLGRTDARAGNTSFGAVLDKYEQTIGGLSASSQKDKRAIITKLKSTWFGIDALPLRLIKPSDVAVKFQQRALEASQRAIEKGLEILKQPGKGSKPSDAARLLAVAHQIGTDILGLPGAGSSFGLKPVAPPNIRVVLHRDAHRDKVKKLEDEFFAKHPELKRPRNGLEENNETGLATE